MESTTPALRQALERLAALKSADPVAFDGPASESDIQAAVAVPSGIPGEWLSAMRVSDGWEYPHDTYYTLIPSIRELPRMQADHASPRLLARYPDFASRFLVIGENEGGDIYCLDRVRANGVCGVTLLSHEGGGIEAEWPSVADFLLEALSDDVIPDED
jgi:hypothetical protein